MANLTHNMLQEPCDSTEPCLFRSWALEEVDARTGSSEAQMGFSSEACWDHNRLGVSLRRGVTE